MWSWYSSTVPMGIALQIHSASPSPCAAVLTLRLPSRACQSKPQGTSVRSAEAICGSHPACVPWIPGTAESGKGRCMLWSCPNVEFGHGCGMHPHADAGELSWVQQRRYCAGQRLLLHLIAALLENVRHWRLWSASEIHATKRGIPLRLPGQTKPSHYINIYIPQVC